MAGLQEVTNALSIPYDLLFPQIRVHNPQPKLQSLLSQERLRLRISNFLRTFTESIRTKAHQNNLGKVSIGVVRESQKLPEHSYIRHIALSSLQQHSFLVHQMVATNFRGNLVHSPSFVALTFRNRLENRNVDGRVESDDDLAISRTTTTLLY